MRAAIISGIIAWVVALCADRAAAQTWVWPQIPPTPPSAYRLTFNPSNPSFGEPITATWEAPGTTSGDWVAIFPAGSTSTNDYTSFCYTNGYMYGGCLLSAPPAGTWELRYVKEYPTRTAILATGTFTVIDPCDVSARNLRLDGPSSVAPWSPIMVRWDHEHPECFAASDWIGIYAAGSANERPTQYFYPGRASGSQVVYAPQELGSYELRYFRRGYRDVARSQPFSVANCSAGDRDCDGRPDASDLCPYWAESRPAADSDSDGRGDECECGDQNGDGRNTVADLVAINQAIFNPALATPLCDTNGDDRCDVQDIAGASREMFSPGQTSTCKRQPVP